MYRFLLFGPDQKRIQRHVVNVKLRALPSFVSTGP
jgi:hypothetical protein